MRLRVPTAVAVLAVVLACGGCGLGPGAPTKGVSLTVTGRFGARHISTISRSRVPGSETVMRMLERSFKISTRYGGGFVESIDSEQVGIAALVLGAGRRTKEDRIDPAAGLVVDAYVGEIVEPGAAPQVVLHHDLSRQDGRVAEARAMIEAAFVIEPADRDSPPPLGSRILEVIR